MKSLLLSLTLISSAWLTIASETAFGLGSFAGIIVADDLGGCHVNTPRDADGVTCMIDRHPTLRMIRVTIQFSKFDLRNPPICTFTGITLGQRTTRGPVGYIPIIDQMAAARVSVVLEDATSCRTGPLFTFSCDISN